MPIHITKKATVPTEKKKPSATAFGLAQADTKAIGSAALERENAFNQLYNNDGTAAAFAPPYDPDRMAALVEENNMLNACIEAMVTNIDGTGFELVPAAGQQDEDIPGDLKDTLTKFFDQPWPGTSFKELRKQLRRDLEVGGNAYLEVIRNAFGDIALMRRMDPGITRVMRYDDKVFEEDVFSPVLGTTIKVKTQRRRFVQYFFGKFVYFKEFGAEEFLDQKTGNWVLDQGGPPVVELRNPVTNVVAAPPDPALNAAGPTDINTTPFAPIPATEVLHFKCIPHHILPYGVPRWVSQLPSVIGSRKAEEFNLNFFDAGGVPPMMIIVQGGETGDKVEQALKDLYYSKGQHKHIATILNVSATGSGSLDDPGNGTAKVTVERFGAERQKDGMFLLYDKNTGDKVRRAFRLPNMFIGDGDAHNYATALASYRIGEVQVFKPERDKFDDVVNSRILPGLIGPDSADKVKYRSLPVAARDVDVQMAAITLAVDGQLIDREEAVDNLNEISDLKMQPSEEPVGAGGLPSSVAAMLPPPTNAQFGPDGKPIQGSGHVQGVEPGKKPPQGFSNPKVAAIEGKLKADVSVEDEMVDEAIEILRTGEHGTQRAFDSVAWMRSIDAEKRDLFGQRVGRAIFSCTDCEAEDAGVLAQKMLEQAEEHIDLLKNENHDEHGRFSRGGDSYPLPKGKGKSASYDLPNGDTWQVSRTSDGYVADTGKTELEFSDAESLIAKLKAKGAKHVGWE